MSPHPILQSEAAECGLACLAMLANAHGLRVDLPALRQRFSVSLKGADLAQLMRHAEALGFATRPLRLELEELPELQLPCMLHWDLNHFVVLVRVRGGGARLRATILDPASGRREVPAEELSRHFTGVALEVTPTAAFQPADLRRRIRLGDLVGRIWGLKRFLFNIILLAIGLEAIAIATPMVTQWVVDGALVTGDRDLLLLTVAGGGLLLLVQFLLSVARGWVALRMNQQLALQFTTNLFAHLLRLPLSFFEKRHVGDITSRFGSLTAIRALLTQGSVSALLDGVMAVVTLAMMLLYSPKLSAVVLVALGLYLLLRLASYRPFRDANEERIVLAAREQSHFLETIRAVQPLKLYGRTAERLARWQNLLVDVQNRDLRTQKMELGFSTVNTLIFGIEGMVILYLGGMAVLERQMTLGMLLAFMAYKGQFTGRASALVNLLVQVKMLSLHAERLADIALAEPEKTGAAPVDAARIAPRIELRGVSFRYADGEPWVLRDCSLVIEPGEHVAICGPSGCGKTTLLKLMLGLLEPNEGEIRVGGLSLRQLGPEAFRQRVGTVMQNDVLFAGTLAENIACFDPKLDLVRVEQAAHLAQIREEILAMPMGFQTLVGDMGSTLSGGQQQRVLLARALYKRPAIFALDEATSHLDEANERRVNAAIRALPLTRVTIAHRRETIAAASRVIVLKDGRVARDVRSARAAGDGPNTAEPRLARAKPAS